MLDDLVRLADCSGAQLQVVLKNNQRLPGGTSKAEAIALAAGALVRAGVTHASDLDPPSVAHRKAYTDVKGLGNVTWSYFLMLLGMPGIKPDRWIMAFVRECIMDRVTPSRAAQLLTTAAAALSVPATELDHAVWSYMRTRKES